ncbi:hypothetical protein BDW72DRAFT_164301 [Aspergillus terricola var. indicus]
MRLLLFFPINCQAICRTYDLLMLGLEVGGVRVEFLVPIMTIYVCLIHNKHVPGFLTTPDEFGLRCLTKQGLQRSMMLYPE